MRTRLGQTIILVLATAPFACASPSEVPAKSYPEHLDAEIAEDRREYIDEHQEELVELQRDIDLIEVKLAHESPYVDAEQKKDWSQDLAELKHERLMIRSELNRAKSVTNDEWRRMRGELTEALDTLEAGVLDLRDEVRTGFKEEESSEPAPPAPDTLP